MLQKKKNGLILVTGGAGFIGSNLVAHYLSRNRPVRLFDNLSREGTEKNLEWLKSLGSANLEVVRGDVRDYSELRRAAADADVIFHLAAQVAVTTSVVDPRTDFDVNALGTFNLIEAARASGRLPVVIYSSTNKVYGGMETARVEHTEDGYRYGDMPFGVSEEWPLDFHSPYGCSKGAADQYVRDYARIYDLPTVVFRQSCIYGPRQFGNEDQGWVAHFTISAAFGRPITIYGDGYQVRDILHVYDLVRAFELAVDGVDRVRGRVYNMGGGPENVISLHWLVRMLNDELGRPLQVGFGDWRPGDQRVYVSDVRKAGEDLGWVPQIDARKGVRQLLAWIQSNPTLFG